MNRSDERDRRPPGRPSKFREPSQPVTVTLPVRILDMLHDFDQDRAVAITRLAERTLGGKAQRRPQVEIVEMAPGTGLIVVESSEILKRLPWLKLIEIAPRRHLITIESGVSIERLEVAISDMIDSLPSAGETSERGLLEQLLGWIRDLRRGRHLSKAELLFVSTARPPKGKRPGANHTTLRSR